MNEKKFDPKKLQKLNDPNRLIDIPPGFVCEKLECDKPDILVEIGAGTALFCIAFLQLLNPSRIYACDISEVMIRWVAENVVPRYPRIKPVQSTEDVVPLDDRIADVVFMINLHHELDDPSRTIAEARRILKPDGEILIVDWKKKAMNQGPPQEIRCLPEEVENQLLDEGFGGIRIFDDLAKQFLVVGKNGGA